MIHLMLVFILASFSAWAEAPDISRRFGLAGAAGWDRPVTGNEFDDDADGEFVHGFYGRYQHDQTSGFQLGYTRYEWSNSPCAPRVYDLVYIHRFHPENYSSFILGAGAGLVDLANYNIDENLKLGLRARAGVEFILSKDFMVDAVIDYQFVNKMIGEDDNLADGEIHALAAQLILAYYFGSI